ncbi:S41 family peptidase [Bacteroidota bacterium]
MRKTIECGLFSPLENDSVIIRGSFNEWTGNNFFLEDVNKDNIYEQTFTIDSDSRITHEFKYLIVKSNGRELWEKYPNKDNKPNGNRFIDSTHSKIDEFDFNKYYLGVVGKDVFFSVEEVKNDFVQFRNTLEEQHCCLYEYTSKQEFDSLFDSQYQLLAKPISPNEFFKILTPITAKIGCGHTAVWMPGGFWDMGKNHLFPLKINLIEDYVVVEGSYEGSSLIKKGSIIQEINNIPISDIVNEMRVNYSADAMNIHFINSQIERRFPLIYARRFGFKDKFQIKYTQPDKKVSEIKELSPTSNSAVRSIVFSNFNHPPLQMEIVDRNTAVIKIPTFIYYDRVSYFTNFIDSCFAVINGKGVNNLILDLRGNDGGDPFCAAPLFSYLQKKPEPYFSEPYGKYAKLAKPIPLPKNHFTGNLYTIIDGRCFSTNGHFCSLLKYHNIGKFVGTESGATYKCNAGKNTEIHLSNTRIMLYFGRSTFATAVKGMDKTKPIMPDHPVRETYQDFLDNKDLFMEKAMEQIAFDNL